MHPANLICLLVLQLLGLYPFSVSAAAAAASRPNHQSIQMIQYTSDALRDYDLADLALLVYKTQPDVVTEILQNMVNGGDLQKSLADEIVRNLKAEARAVDFSCPLCRALVSEMKKSTDSPGNWTQLTEKWISICESITIPRGIKGDILCSGTLNLQMPHVYNVLKPQLNTDLIVCQYLNLCPLLDAEILSDSMTPSEGTARKISSRTDSETDSKSQRKTKQDGARTRQAPPENSMIVVQLTDIHVEPKYAVGSNTDCGLPVCCVPEYGAGDAGKYGDYKCNIPRTTIELFVQKTLTFSPHVVLFSGDVPPHSVWEETPQSQKDCSEILVDVLTKSLPGHNVYPNIGNHEGYPTNLFSVNNLNYTPDFLQWYANLWQPLANFTPQDSANIRKGGFYTKLVSPGLRLISFNTNYMYTFNWYNVENHKPPTSEYTVMTEFVRNSLAQANATGEKVILMGHHPPGGSDYLVKGSRWYRDLVLEYYDIIVLQPTGHTHYDEFRMIYDPDGVPRSVVLVAPSMSSGGTRNPSMRVFYLDKDTKELLDYDHYYLDIGPVLKQGDLPENWADLITLLYSAKDEYSMPDLSPASWHDLLNRFETDSVLLNTHRSHKYADADETPNICLDRCQHNYVCRMRHVNYDQYKDCTISLRDLVDWGSIFNPTTGQSTLPPLPPTGSNNSAENLMSATYLTLSFNMFMLFTMVRGQRS